MDIVDIVGVLLARWCRGMWIEICVPRVIVRLRTGDVEANCVPVPTV